MHEIMPTPMQYNEVGQVFSEASRVTRLAEFSPNFRQIFAEFLPNFRRIFAEFSPNE
jgi:hypothetical protein